MFLNSKKLLGLMLICLLISSCDGVATPSLPPLTSCTPDTNVYKDHINKQILDIYNDGVEAKNRNDDNAFNEVRQKAFDELVNHIYDSSESVVIDLDEKKYLITITYISPEITQLIVVNHYLYKGILTFTVDEMEKQMTAQISGLIDRYEHAFFINFIALQQNEGVTIKFPLNQLELTNTNNLSVLRAHCDQNLEKPILLTNEPQFGFFYFPMAIMKDGKCQVTLDRIYDTRFRLNIPNIWVNDKEVDSQFWEFKYAPLIDMTKISFEHQNKFKIAQSVEKITPKTDIFSTWDRGNQEYWISIARMIWLEITLDP